MVSQVAKHFPLDIGVAGGGQSEVLSSDEKMIYKLLWASFEEEKYTGIQQYSPKLKLYIYFLSFPYHSVLCITTKLYIATECMWEFNTPNIT